MERSLGRAPKHLGWIAPVAALVLGAAGPAVAEEPNPLYQAVAIVTGTGEVNRRLGLAMCLEDVLVKVSGDPRLIGDRRVVALKPQADRYVSAFRYRDRFAHRPINDEQGTRDRPHDLTVMFDPAKIDALLARLGRRPWTGNRPRLVVFVGVHNGSVSYALASDGERGVEQREALAAAARQVAIPMTLPNQAALTAARATYESLNVLEPAMLDSHAKTAGGDLALVGRLTWADRYRGWTAEWRLAYEGRAYKWQVRGASFDDAFRNGMRGAAQVLAGYGRPKSGP